MDFLLDNRVTTGVTDFFGEPSAYRSLLILAVSIGVAYIVSRIITRIVIRFAQIVSVRGDIESDEEKKIMYRQVETYLSVVIAIIRTAIVAVVAFIIWDELSPISSAGVAAVGASAFFIVFAGQTLGTLLRDLTVGASMVIERWFTVGDFIKIEPFLDLEGVVERMTLRSTRLRRLSGEVVWVHNQQIQAVHVTPRGVRTMSVDVFAHDLVAAKKTLKGLIKSIPKGPTMLATPLYIENTEKWGQDLWRITITGQTTPGREWLIERYFVNAIKEVDEGKSREEKLFTQEPIARYADAMAEQRFRRAIRIHSEKADDDEPILDEGTAR